MNRNDSDSYLTGRMLSVSIAFENNFVQIDDQI